VTFARAMTSSLSAAITLTSVAAGASPARCIPPPGFVDTPPPAVAPVDKLVSHAEEIVIDRPLAVVLDAEARTSLEDTIDKKGSLPSVSGTYLLTSGEFGQPGSRRITCLTDGSSLVEQVLVREENDTSAQFRYVVWNYTTVQARPIVYGVGHFVRTNLGNGRTRVRWTYSFRLNRRRFPGFLRGLGDYLFRVNFLDRQYADMMRRTLAGSKARIERDTPVDRR
jgi:hypothetical protein